MNGGESRAHTHTHTLSRAVLQETSSACDTLRAHRRPWMLEAEIEQLRASPLTSIFILTLLTTVVLRKLYQLQLKLATKKD